MASLGNDLENLRTKGKRKFRDGKPAARRNNTKATNTTYATDIPHTTNIKEEAEDQLQNKHNIKFTKEDQRRDRELTEALFSELKDDDFSSNKQQKQKRYKQEVPINQQVELEEEEEQEEEKPAWVDEDDEVLVNAKRALNMPERSISGHVYQERLRNRHKMLSAQSDEWAQVPKPKRDEYDDSDDEGDKILYRSQPLTVPDTRLMSGMIKVVAKPLVHRHQSAVRRVTIHPVEPTAMSVDGNTLKVYRMAEKMEVIHSVRMKDMDILDACFSSDGSQIFLCGNQPSLYILEVGSGKISFLKNILGRKEKRFQKMCASPDGKSCAMLAGSGSIIIISTKSKVITKELRGPSNSVYSAAYAPDGRLFASYGGGVILVWDVERQIPIHSFTNPSLQFSTALAISPNGQYLALGSNIGVVDVFLMSDVMATANPKAHAALDTLVTSINTIKFNHDSQMMAIATDVVKRGLRLVHIPSFNIYQNWPNTNDTFSLIKDASFSPASGFLMTAENTGRVKMFRIPHYPAA